MVPVLLRAGAKANVETRNKVTPLPLAAANGRAPIAKLLLEAGADANHVSVSGATILMAAARDG